jgi:prepilin-type N-terminal cleavage/methylation domain-containing protein
MQIRHHRTNLRSAIANLFRLLLPGQFFQWLGRCFGYQGRKDKSLHMERFVMELNTQIRSDRYRKQRGMTLIELMIAMVVLMVGVVGSMALIAYAMGGNNRSKQQSNSTVVAQMLSEKLSSQKASVSNALVVTDCTGTSTTVQTAAGGGALNSSGEVDLTQAAVTGYQMYYTDCGTSGRQMIYDVRWTITQPTTYTKLIIVSAKMKNAGTDVKMFSLPVTIRTLVGQGT